jgi:uncharacterized membrane protein
MNPRSTMSVAGHPIHVILVPFVIAFYCGALAADIGYAAMGDAFFARMALWLLGEGVVMSVPTALIGLIDFLAEPRIRAMTAAWLHLGGNVLLTLVSAADWYLRYQVGAEQGSQSYIWLAVVAVLILLFNGWMGWAMVYSHHVAVSDIAAPDSAI